VIEPCPSIDEMEKPMTEQPPPDQEQDDFEDDIEPDSDDDER